MSLSNHNVAAIRIPRLEVLLALALCGALLLASPAAESADSGDIVVVRVNGEVRVTTNGEPREAKAGSTLELPAAIRTGHDGSVELRQDHTTVSVGPDTQLDFPAAVNRGDPIERIVQPLGNVFYNVGKRDSRKLRVETPYLVAVIKGTQFNVAAQADSTTISLFEGRLEVRATDDSDVVDLKAGEIAMRHAGDKTIRVLRMDTGKPPTTAPDSERGTAPTTGLAPRPDDDGSAVPRAPSPLDDEVDNLITGRNPGVTVDPVNGEVAAGANVGVANIANAQLNAGIDAAAGSVDLGAGAVVDLGAASLDAGVDTRVDLGAGTIDAGVTVGVDVGPASIDAGVDAAVDLGAGAIDAAVDASVDLGVAAVDVGLDAGVDLGAGTVDLAADAAVDLGVASADLGVDAGVDLGAGTVDAAVDAGVDLGVAAVDVGLDAGVDLSAPAVDVGADIGADLGLVDAGLGVDAGVDVAAGTIDAGVDTSVVGVDVGVDLGVDLGAGDLGLDLGLGGLDVGLDLGLAEDTTAPDTGTTDTGGGLLDGLLRRPGRN